jgi:acyl dehydratase
MGGMMKLPEGLTRLEIPTVEHKVCWRETMNYAAAVRDANPRYLDDSKQRVVAHPVYPVALTWPIVETLEGLLTRRMDREILATKVHATERLRLHRLIRPGDILTISAKVESVLQTRAGALLTVCFEGVDPIGEMVFREWTGALFRGVEALSEGETEKTKAQAPADEALWDTPVKIPRETAHLYDGCTGIVFPIHTSRAFALKAGLPDILLQGTASLAMACREVVDREAAGDPNRIQEIDCRFTGMIFPGHPINIRCTGRSRGETDDIFVVDVVDPAGRSALQAGFRLRRP